MYSYDHPIDTLDDSHSIAAGRSHAMQVSECMSTPPITIGRDSIYHEALKLIQAHGLHHLPVVDLEGKLVGIIAERDLLLAAQHYVQNAVDVAEVMHRDVITVTPDMHMAEAATLMINHKIGSLPVVDAEWNLVGIITESDVYKAFIKVLGGPTELKALGL
jgi:CBS domain-containing protein